MLESLKGPFLLSVRTCLTAAVRRELDGHPQLKLGVQAVDEEGILTLPHLSNAEGRRWDVLLPHLDAHRAYVSATPERFRRQWDDHITAFYGHGLLPADTWQSVQAEHSTDTTVAKSAPACWS